MTNNQNKVFQPICYKGTTFADYEEAMHVLSSNNCVLMDDLFGNQSIKANCDALVAKNLKMKLVMNVMKINYTKKVLLKMLKINCISRVPVLMIFCHLTKIPITYQGIRTIL